MVKKSIPVQIIILFCSLNWLSGQVSTVHIKGYGSTDFSSSFVRFSDWESPAERFIGTPYITEEWMYGELVLDSEESIKTMFRLNLAAQNIEMIYDSDTLIFLQPLRMKEFRFMGRRFIYDIAFGADQGGSYLEAAYFEVLVDGHAQLLRKYEKSVANRSAGVNYAAAATSTNTFQTREVLFIRTAPDEAPLRVNSINGNITDILTGSKADLTAFIEKNSIRLRSLDGLVSLIEYSNSQVEKTR